MVVISPPLDMLPTRAVLTGKSTFIAISLASVNPWLLNLTQDLKTLLVRTFPGKVEMLMVSDGQVLAGLMLAIRYHTRT